jgi:hypothetical protein
MRRTTIFLADDVHEHLRQEAFRKRISLAELIRKKVEPRSVRRSVPRLDNPMEKVIGIVRDGTLTKNLDAELYGD